MLNKAEVLKMLVGLKEVGDLDLVEGDAVLRECCVESDKDTVRTMASIIEQVYDKFDSEMSPEFLGTLDGKPEQVQAMHRKLLDSVKRKHAKKRLGESIVAVLDSDDAYSLVAEDHHHQLNQLKELAASLSEPL